jgi:hypothetical protein
VVYAAAQTLTCLLALPGCVIKVLRMIDGDDDHGMVYGLVFALRACL